MSDITIRKASLTDIPSLLGLINAYAAKGIMLPRTEFEMAENIRDFTVVYDGNEIVGCGALHFYTPTSAEVRSLAVDPSRKSLGLGRMIVESLIEKRGCSLNDLNRSPRRNCDGRHAGPSWREISLHNEAT